MSEFPYLIEIVIYGSTALIVALLVIIAVVVTRLRRKWERDAHFKEVARAVGFGNALWDAYAARFDARRETPGQEVSWPVHLRETAPDLYVFMQTDLATILAERDRVIETLTAERDEALKCRESCPHCKDK